MIDIVFISDLHLHPDETAIQERFDAFIDWAKQSVRTVYILGDFFHAWVGDDELDDWSRGIAQQVHSLKDHGVKVYYMHGNRDFLLGPKYAKLAGWEVLYEPSFITLGDEKVLLMHGDTYCTDDIGHQRFRRLTRNRLFSLLFLRLSLSYRKQLVEKLQARSMTSGKTMDEMDVVVDSVLAHMLKLQTRTLIHGHTHKCGLSCYQHESNEFKRYVLSDWDDKPQILCYDCTKGLYYAGL